MYPNVWIRCIRCREYDMLKYKYTKAQITWYNKKIIELNEALEKIKNWETTSRSHKARSKKVIKALIDAVKLVVTQKKCD